MENNIPDYHNYLVATEDGTWEDMRDGGEYSEDGYELIGMTSIENGNKFIIPEGVRSINIQSSGCAFMKHIVIASTVNRIKDIAGLSICGCIENLSPHFVIEKGILYTADKEELIFAFDCLLEEEEDFIISEGVRKIRAEAFSGCEYIKNIKLPISVKEIGHSAFFLAPNLESITIPSGVSIIKSDTFAFCDELKYVELPDTLITIEEGAFKYCKNLESVQLPTSLRTIGKDVFKGCEKLIKEMSIEEMEDKVPEHINHLYEAEDLTWEDVRNGAKYSQDGLTLYEIPSQKVFIIPQGVECINLFAFAEVEVLHLPSSLKNIERLDNLYGCRKIINKSPHFIIENGILYERKYILFKAKVKGF